MSKGPLDLEPDARKVRGTAFCNDTEARVSRCKGTQLRNGKRDALVSRASFRLCILAAKKRALFNGRFRNVGSADCRV